MCTIFRTLSEGVGKFTFLREQRNVSPKSPHLHDYRTPPAGGGPFDVRPPETALLAHDLAVLIEEKRDKEIRTGWEMLFESVREVLNADCPETGARLQELCSS